MTKEVFGRKAGMLENGEIVIRKEAGRSNRVGNIYTMLSAASLGISVYRTAPSIPAFLPNTSFVMR